MDRTLKVRRIMCSLEQDICRKLFWSGVEAAVAAHFAEAGRKFSLVVGGDWKIAKSDESGNLGLLFAGLKGSGMSFQIIDVGRSRSRDPLGDALRQLDARRGEGNAPPQGPLSESDAT
jgi:hypothetical protein